MSLISCATTKIRQDQTTIGEWEARVLVRDKKQSNTFIVNADFFAIKPNQVRMDITTPLGIHVASVAIDQNEMTYIVPQKKSYYDGKATPVAFSKILSFALDPNLISNILFDQPIQGKGWVCKTLRKVLSECAQGKFKIAWGKRKAAEKTVVITHPQFQVELKFHKFSVPKTLKPELFSIQKPAGFNTVN